MPQTTIHPRLLADCHLLGRLPDAWLLLHRDAAVPWFILVPDSEHTALFELERSQRRQLTDLWDDLADFTYRYFDCARVNQAAIGNLVPQLHLHTVGRREDDPCWPGVVWGALSTDQRWSAEALATLGQDLVSALGLDPSQALKPPGEPGSSSVAT